MRKNLKVLAAFIIISIITLAAATWFFYAENTCLGSQKVEDLSPHYLSYMGDASKIYLVSASTSYGAVNESYTTFGGQLVQKGSTLFIIVLTMRNDYSAENPPPPNVTPVSPADGTVYVCLKTELYNENGVVNVTNVTVGDFSVPETSGSGFVLASGQTASIEIYLATSQLVITRYGVNLVFVGDTIPTNLAIGEA
jgi:hypothetical protein